MPKTKMVQDVLRVRLIPWYEQSMGCSLQVANISASLLSPSIELADVQLVSKNPQQPWQCQCKKITIQSSWLGLFFKAQYALSITLDKPTITSGMVDGKLCVVEDHIKRYFASPAGLPIVLDALVLTHAQLDVSSPNNPSTIKVFFSGEYKKRGHVYALNVHAHDAALQYGDALMLQGVKGYWQSTFSASGALQGKGQGSLLLFQGDHAEPCYWDAHADKGKTMVTVWRQQAEDACIVTIDQDKLDVQLSIALSRIAQHSMPQAYAHMVKGSLHAGYTANFAQGLGQGELTIAVQDSAYGKHVLFEQCSLTSLLQSKEGYGGTVLVQVPHKKSIKGSWSFDPKTKKGIACVVDDAGTELGRCTLEPEKGGVSAHVLVKETSQEGNAPLFQATAHYAQGAFSVQGDYHQEQFFMQGSVQKALDISLLRWIDGNKNTLIDFAYDALHDHAVKGVVDMGALQRIVKGIYGINMYGEGVVRVDGHYTNKRYELAVNGPKIAIRIPRVYNVINSFSGTIVFDPQASILTLSDVQCMLHRGSLALKKAVFTYNPETETLFYTVPLTLSSCWFNVEKDVYAFISGSLVLQRNDTNLPLLSGELIVERAHISETILHLPEIKKVQSKKLFGQDVPLEMKLDVQVYTKNPIRITLATIEGSARCSLHIGNTVNDPALSGFIRIDDGAIVFPYKPLNVRKAQLTFTPQQTFDPSIEVLAKNHIKGYDVSLQVQGTLSSHDVKLQSNPPLTDEQLISLLYAGSEHGTIASLLPTMVMHNISALFSKKHAAKASSGPDKNSWRERLKRVRLVPGFVDQHARGGLRGKLEVDINDRWRAIMEKNFSLSEDTSFELDYELSDDVLLRGIRDERRDVGAEVEVKMKF